MSDYRPTFKPSAASRPLRHRLTPLAWALIGVVALVVVLGMVGGALAWANRSSGEVWNPTPTATVRRTETPALLLVEGYQDRRRIVRVVDQGVTVLDLRGVHRAVLFPHAVAVPETDVGVGPPGHAHEARGELAEVGRDGVAGEWDPGRPDRDVAPEEFRPVGLADHLSGVHPDLDGGREQGEGGEEGRGERRGKNMRQSTGQRAALPG